MHSQLVTTLASLFSMSVMCTQAVVWPGRASATLAPSMQQHDVVPDSGKGVSVATGCDSSGADGHKAGLCRRPCVSKRLMSAKYSLSTFITCPPGLKAFLSLSWCPFRSAGAHEAGHRFAAAKHSVKLSPPFLLPSALGLLGSFGAITRFRSTVPNR